VKFQPIRFAANALIAGTLLTVPLAITSPTSNAAGLPLYQFVDSGSGALPWNAVSFESSVDSATMLGGPHAASDNGATALAIRASNADIGLYVHNASGTTQYSDLSTQVTTPEPENDPIPFFDPNGAVDVLYVSSAGHIILISPNYNVTARRGVSARLVAPAPFTSTDLTTLSGVSAANSLPSISVNGQTGLIVVRTASNDIEALPLLWRLNQSVPTMHGAAVDVSSLTSAGASQSDPVALNTPVPSFVTIAATGALDLFTNSGGSSWFVQNLSLATLAPTLTGPIATQTTDSNVYIAALNTGGDVELFGTAVGTIGANVVTAHASHATTTTTIPSSPWSLTNVTNATPNAPPLAGQFFLAATDSQISVAGQAANWGDLFVMTSPVGAASWSATNVSVTATNAARTIGSIVTGTYEGGDLVLFAAGVNSPPPEGVGVYAIPSADWTEAITNGWPILSETGGLGTRVAPWVGYTSASTTVATSPDFLMGQAIYNSHKRVTWLSFWTVSGPLTGQPQTPATYYSHGFAAGAWVATQIDQYRALGVGLKPDWVIFDPEGYPNNSSNLVAPAGATGATLQLYSTYWTGMLQGWAAGIASVDPSLNAGVYANQSEYRNYNLAAQPLPVFEAVAFGGGGPTVVDGASGSNIRGYIAFSAVCNPASTLASEMSTLVNPPWSGQFNTLQFNASAYCPPAPS
jgi:hypothetical protein